MAQVRNAGGITYLEAVVCDKIYRRIVFLLLLLFSAVSFFSVLYLYDIQWYDKLRLWEIFNALIELPHPFRKANLHTEVYMYLHVYEIFLAT